MDRSSQFLRQKTSSGLGVEVIAIGLALGIRAGGRSDRCDEDGPRVGMLGRPDDPVVQAAATTPAATTPIAASTSASRARRVLTRSISHPAARDRLHLHPRTPPAL